MPLRLRLTIFLPLVAVLAAIPVAHSLAASGSGSAKAKSGGSTAASTLSQGKALYREFCGQCHALSSALAAGFGSDKGLGQYGGPSFNNLKITYDLAYVAVTGQFGGHEIVMTRITIPELDKVCAFVAAATKHNPYLARVSDG